MINKITSVNYVSVKSRVNSNQKSDAISFEQKTIPLKKKPKKELSGKQKIKRLFSKHLKNKTVRISTEDTMPIGP